MSNIDSYFLDSFQTTRSSLVALACDADPAKRREALDELLRVYLPALRVYLKKRWRLSQDRAEDILQSFVTTQILERQLIGRFDAARGRFRALLLKSLQNFASRQLARERNMVDIDHVELDDATMDGDSAALAYDIAWGRQILRDALQRMQFVCRAEDNLERWEIFLLRIVRPLLAGVAAPSLKELADRCGVESTEQASNILVTAKRQFARILRRLVAETEQVASDSDIDEVIAELATILQRAGAFDGYWEDIYGESR